MLLRLLLTITAFLLTPTLALAWCVGGAPPARDADADGLNDIQEAYFGTDPALADSDGDGTRDGDEDADGDGIANHDEPHLFSLEVFPDPFSPTQVTSLLLEGTNFFLPESGDTTAEVVADQTQNEIQVEYSDGLDLGTRRTRILLDLSPTNLAALLGSSLDATLSIETARGTTNTLHPVPMPCATPEPHLMGAALVELRSPVFVGPLRYVVIGGCNLLDAHPGSRVSTRVVLADGEFLLRSHYPSSALLPARLLIPVASPAVSDSALAAWQPIQEGDTVQVVTSAGASQTVLVEGPIAQLHIPPSNATEDHDGDRLTSVQELILGTDPLVWDSDRDGASDGREVLKTLTDPLDPDTDGDGILDGDEGNAGSGCGLGFELAPLLVALRRARRSGRRRLAAAS